MFVVCLFTRVSKMTLWNDLRPVSAPTRKQQITTLLGSHCLRQM